jgi:hypothetical protein
VCCVYLERSLERRIKLQPRAVQRSLKSKCDQTRTPKCVPIVCRGKSVRTGDIHNRGCNRKNSVVAKDRKPSVGGSHFERPFGIRESKVVGPSDKKRFRRSGGDGTRVDQSLSPEEIPSGTHRTRSLPVDLDYPAGRTQTKPLLRRCRPQPLRSARTKLG